jgi:hypothetical protein
MFYIVTYTTHSERYFELLKQSCPDIIVLGYGEKWNGFNDKVKASVKFCKSKQPDDIICFVDGFDSVVLTSKEEILEKYKTFDIPLVFSQDMTTSSIIIKYGQDKVFGRCKNKRLNAGLIIGTAESIIDFWSDIQENEDDQEYATRKCKKINYMKIDVENKLFYNYSSADTINIKNNSLFINNNKYPTSIISAPANNNINHILSQLNYKNLPDNKNDFKYRISTYGKYFIKEFILALLIVSIFVYFKNIPFSIIISLIFVCSFLEYELIVKHLDTTTINKILYLIIDFIHLFICFFIIYLMINFDCNIQKLLLLDIIYFSIIGLFFYFKSCILTIISNKLINKQNCSWNGYSHRISYFFDINKSYEKCSDTNSNINTTELWMNGNIINVSIIILLNIHCLWKISTGTSCIPINGFKNNQRRNYIKKKKV